MAEVQTKALFTCTEAGYDAALSIMELYRRNGMQAFFYGRLHPRTQVLNAEES